MTPEGIISIVNSNRFFASLHRIETARISRGVSIFAPIDHASLAVSAGLALRPTEVLMVGNARCGPLPMAKFPQMAIDLPLRILIWEEDGGYVRLDYDDPEWIAQRHTDRPAPHPQIKAMQTALSEILAETAGGKE